MFHLANATGVEVSSTGLGKTSTFQALESYSPS
jgi:hypothetical protein